MTKDLQKLRFSREDSKKCSFHDISRIVKSSIFEKTTDSYCAQVANYIQSLNDDCYYMMLLISL